MSADFTVTGDTSLNASGAKKGLDSLVSMGGKAASGLMSSFAAIGGGIMAVGTAIVGLGATAVKYNADMEQYSTSFEVMTGSAEGAADIMERLKKLGAETPFEFTDLASATQTLMAFGLSADDAINSFGMLGDISQGNAEKLKSMTGAYGKMMSSGKVTLEQLNVMTEAGFNPLNLIAQKTGESMSDLYTRVSKGKVSVDEITDAMQTATSAGGQFYQSMDKQSQTLNGRLSTLKDNFQQFTGAIFQSSTESTAGVVNLAIDWVQQLQDAFTSGGVTAMVTALGDILAQAVGQAASFAPQVINIAVSVISAFLQGIQDNAAAITGGGTSIITALIAGIGALIPQLLTTGAVILQGLVQGLVTAAGSMGDGLNSTSLALMGNFITSITAQIPTLLTTGVAIVNGLLNGLTQAAPVIIQGAAGILSALMTGITTNAGSLIQSAFALVAQLATGLGQALPGLIPQAVTMVITIVEGLLDNVDLLIDAAVDLIVGLATGLIRAVPILLEKAPEIIGKLLQAIIGAAPKIALGAVQLVVELVKGLVEAIPKWTSMGPRLIEEVFKAFQNNVAKFNEIGPQIIKGIWEGLKSGWNWLVDQVANLAGDLLKGAKNALGIHSPSKEFIKVGMNVIAGWNKPLENANLYSPWEENLRINKPDFERTVQDATAAIYAQPAQYDIVTAKATDTEPKAPAQPKQDGQQALADAIMSGKLAGDIVDGIAGLTVGVDGRELGRIVPA